MKWMMLLLSFNCGTAVAQLAVGSDSMKILSGEIFHCDGLTLNPSTDFILASTMFEWVDDHTITPIPVRQYRKRYFVFSNSTPSFSGTLRFSYAGAILQGSNGLSIPESDLRMNSNNGFVWRLLID
jgi:hypothetical protein